MLEIGTRFRTQNINIKTSISTNSTNQNHDSVIAKNIIDILFNATSENLKNDKKMTLFMKKLISNQLPGIRDGSKDFINDMSSSNIKKLLDDIQNQLNSRK